MKIEYYLPQQVITNEMLKAEFTEWDHISFEAKVGIKNRYVVKSNETALDLAVNASEKVLTGINRKEVDFVILCTQSPEYFLPTTACILQDRLGLPIDCGAFDFNLGCSGYVYGLAIAKGLLAGKLAQNILFVVSETYSRYIHPADRTNRSIFGDGAAATILTTDDLSRLGNFELKTDGSGFDKLIVKNGASKYKYDRTAELKNYGTENSYTDNHLYMNGPDIFNFTIEKIPVLIEATLKKNNLTTEDIDYYIFHQANAFMLNFLRKKMKIPTEKFYINLENMGNTVSATIPIAIKDALSQNLIKPNDRILLAGFGVGLSWGATIITI